MCRKFTLIFTTDFVGSLDIRASREIFSIEVRSPEIISLAARAMPLNFFPAPVNSQSYPNASIFGLYAAVPYFEAHSLKYMRFPRQKKRGLR